MKKLVALVAIMLMASTAFAQIDPGNNGIGIYTTTAATAFCRATMPAAGANLTMYLMVTNLTNTHGISGYECGVKVLLSGGQTLADDPSVTLPTGWLNVGSWPNFQCAGTSPLPQASIMQLAKIVVANATGYDEYGDPIAITGGLAMALGPCNPSSFGPGTLWPQYAPGPGYADGQDPGILAPLVPSSSQSGGAPYWYKVYTAGQTCVVDNEPSSWSNVKSLYQ